MLRVDSRPIDGALAVEVSNVQCFDADPPPSGSGPDADAPFLAVGVWSFQKQKALGSHEPITQHMTCEVVAANLSPDLIFAGLGALGVAP